MCLPFQEEFSTSWPQTMYLRWKCSTQPANQSEANTSVWCPRNYSQGVQDLPSMFSLERRQEIKTGQLSRRESRREKGMRETRTCQKRSGRTRCPKAGRPA